MTVLADKMSGRENNLDVLRLIFAAMVLYGHSFAVMRPGFHEPIGGLFVSTSLPEIGVNAFFVVSGLLITMSINRNDVVYYTASRVLRIYPALIVCALVTILAMSVVSSLPAEEYFAHPQTEKFLHNAHVSKTVVGLLPGVFEGRPIEVVNVSLWTLVVELRCYLIVGILGLLGIFRNQLFGTIAAIIMLVMIWTDIGPNVPLIHEKENWHRVFSNFMIGAIAYFNRHSIPLRWDLFVGSLISFYLMQGQPDYEVFVLIPFAYAVLFLSYGFKMPNPTKKPWFGDISYGLYIYAFPIQQLYGWYYPEMNVFLNAFLSLVSTAILAWVSFHLLEKHALKVKKWPSHFIDFFVDKLNSSPKIADPKSAK